MNKDKIKLLQFLICRDFSVRQQDRYTAEHVLSNLYVSRFPYTFNRLFAVTCWRKDTRFHKEVIEYEPDEGIKVRTAHMDIEPVTSKVLFRWHKHRFPAGLTVRKNTHLTVRVILDGETVWESYILVEKKTGSQGSA